MIICPVTLEVDGSLAHVAPVSVEWSASVGANAAPALEMPPAQCSVAEIDFAAISEEPSSPWYFLANVLPSVVT